VPDDYYLFLRGDISKSKLFSLHPDQASAAKDEAWLDALGSGKEFDDRLDERITKIINGKTNGFLLEALHAKLIL